MLVLVRLQDGVVAEVRVAVQVDARRPGGRVVEHAPLVGDVTVAVEVARHVAATGGRLLEELEAVRAGRSGVRLAAARERRTRHPLVHPQPGAVTVVDGVGGRHPVDDLALAGGGLLQRGVAEVHTGVQDADGDPAAVGLRVLLDEVDCARLEGRVVRVLRRGVLARCRVTARDLLLLRTGGPVARGRRVVQLDLLLEIDALDGGELLRRLDGGLGGRGRHGRPDVAELVVRLPQHGPLDGVQLRGDLLGRTRGGGDHHGDVLLALGLGLRQHVGVRLAQLVALRARSGGLHRGGRRVVGCEDRGGAGGGQCGRQTGRGRDTRRASRPGYGAGGFLGHQHP